MTSKSSNASVAKSLCWPGFLRYSLRTLLVCVTLFALIFAKVGYTLRQYRHQQDTIEEISRLGGSVDSETTFLSQLVQLWDVNQASTYRNVFGVALLPDEETYFRRWPGGGYSGPPPFTEGTGINDKRLALIRKLPNLEKLYLCYTNISDAGLIHLVNLPHLESLHLDYTDVTDQGLTDLKKLKSLNYLTLAGTSVTDAGLATLSSLQQLKGLSLRGTEITSDGLLHLAALKNLLWLDLSETGIGSDALVHLRTLTNLEEIGIWGTNVDDTGLMHLKSLINLQFISGAGGRITPQGRMKLRNSLPGIEFYGYPMHLDELSCLEARENGMNTSKGAKESGIFD